MIKTIYTAAVALLIAAFLMFIITWPVQWLWNNALYGAAEGINQISFWQTLGILILSKLLFSPAQDLKLKENE
jgi:hypothetical protein